MSKQQVQFEVDELIIDPNTIQQAYKSAVVNNQTSNVVASTFKVMDLFKTHQINPAQLSAKEQIKSIIQNNMISNQSKQIKFSQSFNNQQVFPLKKPGNFGREIQRKCTISDQGLMEYQDKKQPKLKVVKNFVNNIERFGNNKQNNKLEWLEIGNKYPYRIILIDSNNNEKALFLKNEQQAEQVRLHFCMKFRCKKQTSLIFKVLSQQLRRNMMQSFKFKVMAQHKMTIKSNSIRQSLKSVEMKHQKSFNKLRVSQKDQEKVNEQSVKNLFLSKTENKLKQNQVQIFNKSRISTTSNKMIDKSKLLMNLEDLYISGFLRQWIEKNQNFMAKKFKKQTKSNFLKGEKQKIINANQIKQSVQFTHIQFIQLRNLYFKPVLTIKLVFQDNIQHEGIYNTLIKKKQPNLQYFLIFNSNDDDERNFRDGIFSLCRPFRDYKLHLVIMDYITGAEVAKDIIVMSSKILNQKMTIESNNHSIRLGIQFTQQNKNKSYQKKQTDENNVLGSYLMIPELEQFYVNQIRQYWETMTENISYDDQSDLTIFEILNRNFETPLTWWIKLEEQDYTSLNILLNASKIFHFKLIPSFLHIVRAFKKLYTDIQQLIKSILSILIHFMKSYYMIKEMNQLRKFHTILGFQEKLDFSAKINLEMNIIMKIVEEQSSNLAFNLKCRHICYRHQIYQYIYEMYSRNFNLNILIGILNFVFKHSELIEMYLLLLGVWLIIFYQDELNQCDSLQNLKTVLQSCKYTTSQEVIKGVLFYRSKYFGQSEGILQHFKNILSTKPLQSVIMQFYQSQNEKLDQRKKNRQVQKNAVLQQIITNDRIQFGLCKSKTYCLHIYFYILPSIQGSLYLKSDEVEYECIGYQQNRYFIIGEIGSDVKLQFIDNKANQLTCQLQLTQGINQFKISLQSNSGQLCHKIQYMAALLTEEQIKIITKNGKFEHFIGPYFLKDNVMDEMLVPVSSSQVFQHIQPGKQQSYKKIKLLFSTGSRLFNEVEFNLMKIYNLNLTIAQKLKLVIKYASILSLQHYMCVYQSLQKLFLQKFFQFGDFPLSEGQFLCYYNNSLQCKLDSAKILKCRFYPSKNLSQQLYLETQAMSYLAHKSSLYLEVDIIIVQFIKQLRSKIQQSLSGTICQGQLKILYSSDGKLHFKVLTIYFKKNSKDILIKQQVQNDSQNYDVIQGKEPDLLMTEVMPTFSKISTILNYANSNNSTNFIQKHKDKFKKKTVTQNINILQKYQPFFKKIIRIRYNRHPKNLNIPFLAYYYDLTSQITAPLIQKCYFNSCRSDIKAICTCDKMLKFSDNPLHKNQILQQQLGLWGNLRKFPANSTSFFFWSNQQEESEVQQAQIFIHYGYGVYKWENCIIKGYCKRNKRQKQNRANNQSKIKLCYIILHNNRLLEVRDYEVRIKPQVKQKLKQIKAERSLYKEVQTVQIGLSFLSKFIN